MESHEKKEQKDKNHIGKMIRKSPNKTGGFYSWLLDNRSKTIVQVKNSAVKL